MLFAKKFLLRDRLFLTVRKYAETIKKLLGRNIEIVYCPARLGDYSGREVSNIKAKEILGWGPKVDFEEGMKKTIDWFKSHYGIN